MTQFQARIIVAIDEWLGAFYLAWLWHAHRETFWYVFVWWAVCVYGIGYPMYWRKWDRWWRK